MGIDKSNKISNSNLEVDGDLIVGNGNNIIHLKEANDYKILITQLKELDEEYRSLEEEISKNPKIEFLRIQLQKVTRNKENKKNELDRLIKSIKDLFHQISSIPLNSERLHLINQLIHNGQFSEARKILNSELIASELDTLRQELRVIKSREKEIESQIITKAQEFLILASLTSFDYSIPDRYDKTVQYFEQSINATKLPENLYAYAHYLQQHNNDYRALDLYEEALSILRGMKESEPEIYLPRIADTLNNLGNLYSHLLNYEKARDAFIESIDIRRNFVKINPKAFLPSLANSINNLGIVYAKTNKFKHSEELLFEALEIRKKLAEDDLKLFALPISETLSNLGNLYNREETLVASKKYFDEALSLLRGLINDDNSDIYYSKIVGILISKSVVLNKLDNPIVTEEVLLEAYSVQKDLILKNHHMHLPKYAKVTMHLSKLYQDKIPNKEKSLFFAKEAIRGSYLFKDVFVNSQYCFDSTLEIVKGWGLDEETFIRDSMN